LLAVYLLAVGVAFIAMIPQGATIRRAHDWVNSRRWFIRCLVYAELAILARFITLIVAASV